MKMYVGHPILSGGKKWYPVLKYSSMRFPPFVVEYCETKEEAENL